MVELPLGLGYICCWLLDDGLDDEAWVGVPSGVIDDELEDVDCFGLARRIVPVSPTRGLGGGGRDAKLSEEPVSSGVLHTGSSPGAGGGGRESSERFDLNISGGGGGSGSLSDSASSVTLDGEGGGGNEVIESIWKNASKLRSGIG